MEEIFMEGSYLGDMRFSSRDQDCFAALSGDRNPVHLDPLIARRTQLGQVVVHGIHVVLRGLEMLAPLLDRPKVTYTLAVRFLKPIFLEETVAVRVSTHGTSCRIWCEVKGTKVMVLTLSPAVIEEPPHVAVETVPQTAGMPLAVPCVLDYRDMPNRCGRVVVQCAPSSFTDLFPALAAWIGSDTVRDLASLSTLVGMECPGLYSLFSGFHVHLKRIPTENALTYAVVATDVRNHLVRMNVCGTTLFGTVDAIARSPPAEQQSIRALTKIISPDEFRGQVALVIGGSRGLGELTAKLLAAGGAHPIITYNVGREDAMRVAAEIGEIDRPCDILGFDVIRPAVPQFATLTARPTSLYYFATPKIFARRANRFDPELFSSFYAYYCNGLADVCAALVGTQGGLAAVFYPSTISIDERPVGMTEYTMAKAAGEVLCRDLPFFHSGLRVITKRLPRIWTDQTATVFATETADAVEAMLPVVRAMCGTSPQPLGCG
ncbi:MAG: hypothetical protein H7837_02635 [Magnetococcus sp. MYC-9]